MVKVIGGITFILILLLGVATTNAQEKTLSEAEYKAYINRSNEIFRVSPYREYRVMERSEGPDLSWQTFNLTLAEHDGPARDHTTTTNFGPDGYVCLTETIRIGKDKYEIRRDVTGSPGEKNLSVPLVDISKFKRLTEYSNLGPGFVEGTLATVIQEKTGVKTTVNGIEVEVTDIEKRWVGEDGRLLKMESLDSNTARNPSLFFRVTTTYEYDPKIKIEPPAKDRVKKASE